MASEGNGKNRVTSTTKCQELYCPVLLLFSAALLHSHAHKHNNAKKKTEKKQHTHINNQRRELTRPGRPNESAESQTYILLFLPFSTKGTIHETKPNNLKRLSNKMCTNEIKLEADCQRI